MHDISAGARAHLLSVTAALSAVLLVSALAGFVVGMGGADALPAQASAEVGTSSLPLRIPAPTVTVTGRPTAAATPDVGPTLRVPTAAQRDRELAALSASSGNAPAMTALPEVAPLPATNAMPDTAVLPTIPVDEYADPATDSGPWPDPAPDTRAGSSPPGSAPPGSSSSGTASSGTAASFVVSSFNVLGSSHTRNGGRGRASGVVRTRGTVQLLDRHDVDVAGFQELQADQVRELLRLTNNAYAIYPGAGPGKDSDNSIGWRTSQFKLVSASTIPVPYFNGHRRKMPVVLLKHKASGVKSWFANFHNPAETHRYRNQQKWRTQATIIEANLANRLHPTGVPLFVTGDMNERTAYFCRFTKAAPSMKAARGGTNGIGGCRAGRPRVVDWIFGSKGVSFSNYNEDRSPLVDRTTDHPVITSRVRVDASVFPRAVSP